VNRRLPDRQGAIPRLMAIRTDHNLSAVLERARRRPITLASMTLKREKLPQGAATLNLDRRRTGLDLHAAPSTSLFRVCTGISAR
jgi:hypothetical protein